MQFEWDPAKAAASLKRHRVSFHEAAAAFTWEKLRTPHVEITRPAFEVTLITKRHRYEDVVWTSS